MLWLFRLERRICSIICCMLCLGPILVVIGVFVLASSTHDSRGAAISKFNAAVDAWSTSYRSEFEALNNISLNINGLQYFANASTAADTYSDHDDKLETYSPLKYVIPLYPFFGTRPWAVYNNSFNGKFYNNSSFIVTDELRLTATYQPYISDCKSTDVVCNDCTQKSGNWVNGVCTVKQVLSGYCLKVDNSSGSWSPSGVGVQFGCGAGGNWGTNTLSTVPFSTTSYTYNGQVVIRSAHDPYVIAAQITGGSFNFGLTRKQKAEVGFILIIVGGACMVPIILISVLCYRRLAKKHEHHHHHHHHYHQAQGGFQAVYN